MTSFVNGRWTLPNMPPDLSLFLEGISQVAVGIGEMRLQLNGPAVGVNGQLDQPGKSRQNGMY